MIQEKALKKGTSAPAKWDYEADVIVLGAGAAGLPAAVRARDLGASVIVVDCNWDTGGHAAVSGGFIHLGGGHSVQKAAGVKDSAEQVYEDNTHWIPSLSRFNDRDVIRTFADNNAPAFEFILENGVKIIPGSLRAPMGPSYLAGGRDAMTVPRTTRSDIFEVGWKSYNTGIVDSANMRSICGHGLTRPLEVSARKKGVKFLLNYHMDVIFRETPKSGRVLGIQASYSPTILPGEKTPLKSLFSNGNIRTRKKNVTIKANKGIIIATGGSTGNLNFRRIFDPRITEEYDGVAGYPFSIQDASGEMAGLAIGASLGDTANQTTQAGAALTKPGKIGCRYGYRNLTFTPGSPIWSLVGASGLEMDDWQNAILVNMLGKRFYDETKSDYDYLAAAMGSVVLDEGTTKSRRVGGPIWAIFDSEAVKRLNWKITPEFVDEKDGRFFRGNTIAELAKKIVNKYFENVKMPPKVLEETVARYNSFVDKGVDEDFKKAKPLYKIQKGPFYAAWATPTPHDCLAGLRINGKNQVLDIYGEAIQGLYAAGEAASGNAMHGHGKNIAGGYSAGTFVAQEKRSRK